MNEPMLLAFAAVGGFALGAFFFGTLWWTVQRLPDARWPGLLVLASFIGRMAVVLVGFVLVAGGQGERFFASLAGFLIARLVLVRKVGARAITLNG